MIYLTGEKVKIIVLETQNLKELQKADPPPAPTAAWWSPGPPTPAGSPNN